MSTAGLAATKTVILSFSFGVLATKSGSECCSFLQYFVFWFRVKHESEATEMRHWGTVLSKSSFSVLISCGPPAFDLAQIGNLRCIYFIPLSPNYSHPLCSLFLMSWINPPGGWPGLGAYLPTWLGRGHHFLSPGLYPPTYKTAARSRLKRHGVWGKPRWKSNRWSINKLLTPWVIEVNFIWNIQAGLDHIKPPMSQAGG